MSMRDFESVGRGEERRRRAAVVAHLRQLADSRRENSDDQRDARSANALDGLADYVENQPESDVLLAGLVFLEEWQTDVYVPGAEAQRLLSGYGVDSVVQPDRFLIEWARAAMRDAKGRP
jgi:hypothetical protein